MKWRFVRGRMIQNGRVALLRGPVLFTFSDELNASLLKICPQPRDLVLDPASIGNPIRMIPFAPTDRRSSSRRGRIPERSGKPVDVVLTEFVDPTALTCTSRSRISRIRGRFESWNDELLSSLTDRGNDLPEVKIEPGVIENMR